MSLAADRQAFVTALGPVDWVNAFQYPPDGGYRAGDAWPLVSRIDYPNRFGGVVSWEVLVVLHADVATAEQLMDTYLPDVREALAPLLAIKSVTPRLLTFETGSALTVAVIAGIREE